MYRVFYVCVWPQGLVQTCQTIDTSTMKIDSKEPVGFRIGCVVTFFQKIFLRCQIFCVDFIGFSSPKEQDSEDSVKPENASPNRDWIPPEDQNQPNNSVSFDWLNLCSDCWLVTPVCLIK